MPRRFAYTCRRAAVRAERHGLYLRASGVRRAARETRRSDNDQAESLPAYAAEFDRAERTRAARLPGLSWRARGHARLEVWRTAIPRCRGAGFHGTAGVRVLARLPQRADVREGLRGVSYPAIRQALQRGSASRQAGGHSRLSRPEIPGVHRGASG